MHNVFQHQRSERARSRETERIQSEQTRKLRTAIRRDKLHHTSLLRASEWATEHLDGTLASSTSYAALLDGAVPLLHPALHQFRDGGERKNIYVRKYQPAVTRAAEKQVDFHLTHLEEVPYEENSPHKTMHWLRQSPTPTDRFRLPPDSFRFQEDRSRLLRRVKRGRFVQTEAADMYSAVYPQFRRPTKDKWTVTVPPTQHDFNRFTRHYGGEMSVWQSPQLYQDERYVDGLENMGLITRKRDAKKETAGEFKITTPREIWQKVVPPLTSLRSGKAGLQLARLSCDTGESASTSAPTSARSTKFYVKSIETQLRRTKLQRSTSELGAQAQH